MNDKKYSQLEKRIALLEAAVFGSKASDIERPQLNKEPKRKKNNKNIIIPPVLEDLSHSEIVEISKHVFSKFLKREELAVFTRQIKKEDLISLIREGYTNQVKPIDPLKDIRQKIFDFINRNEILRSNLDCSTHCPTCPYSKVINCHTVNGRIINNEINRIKFGN